MIFFCVYTLLLITSLYSVLYFTTFSDKTM